MSPEINIPADQHKKILNKLHDWTLWEKRGGIHFLQQQKIANWMNYILPEGGVIAVEIDKSWGNKERRIYTLYCSDEQEKKLKDAGILNFSEPQQGK